MTQPSPDDVPEIDFVSADDADALADLGPLSPQNPAIVAFAFFGSLIAEGGPVVEQLRLRVTPESLLAWDDFSEAARGVRGYTITTRPNPALGADLQPVDDVVYAKLVPDMGEAKRFVADGYIEAKVLTLQRRPDLNDEWFVHSVGLPTLPEDLP